MNADVLIQKVGFDGGPRYQKPLSSIKLISQALLTRKEIIMSETYLRMVNVNISVIDNLLVLVDEIMAYSEKQALLFEKRQEFELNVLINRTVSLLTVPEGIRIEIPADKHAVNSSIVAMEQILIKLMSNAIRYNDKPERWIKYVFQKTTWFWIHWLSFGYGKATDNNKVIKLFHATLEQGVTFLTPQKPTDLLTTNSCSAKLRHRIVIRW